MENKVFVVTVTYGNRFHLLKQVIEAALSEGVYKVIVVDNNSELDSKNKLMEYEKLLNGKIKVLYLDDNYGSAGGFKKGLELAYDDPECEFIWLLDDDNLPLHGSLEQLINLYNEKLNKYDKEKLMIGCYRPAPDRYLNLVLAGKKNIADNILLCKNTFKGFHFKRLFYEVFYRKNKIINNNNIEKIFLVNEIEIKSSGYSGLFFHKSVINQIGFPDADLFLYSDDVEFTLRFTSKGGKIFIAPRAILKDLDMSYELKEFGIIGLSDFKCYYSVRNQIIVEKKYCIDNKFVYTLNKFIFKTLIKIMYFTKRMDKSRYRLILKAIKDGEAGLKGRTF